jgi:superfamily II DNA or RNA helicase
MNHWNLNFKPRGWQKEALPLWNKQMSGVVSVVTGGGKTFFAFITIIDFIKKYPDGNIVIVVPTIALQDQWYAELITNLKVSPKDVICFPNKKKIINKINIIVINTARNINSIYFQNKDVFLIVDECHKAGSKLNAKALDIHTRACLGLSATPKRQYDDGFENYIQPKLGKIIYEYGYKEAYKDGVISDFEVININTNLSFSEQTEYDKISKQIAILLNKKPFVNQEKIDRLLLLRSRVSKNSINRIPIALKLLNQDIKKKTIVFTESKEQANQIFNELEKKGRLTALYHTGVSKVARQFNLVEFMQGTYRSLITCTAVDEGLNVPDIEIAIIVSQTKSIRQRIQRLGRALRKGKEKATIYTIYITDEEKEQLMKEYNDFYDIAEFKWLKTQ